jgi:hypothetical protein
MSKLDKFKEGLAKRRAMLQRHKVEWLEPPMKVIEVDPVKSSNSARTMKGKGRHSTPDYA